ncbi:MAG: ABC transporter substrate-binding protein, partial [Bacteroidota bacterium]
RTKSTTFDMIAIAAILQYDLSAIAVRAEDGIHSPRDLDGKSYASYQARYEDEIVKQMIRNDGGKGEIELIYPKKLGIWDTVIEGTYDATWIFLNWEGVAAEASKVALRYFKMRDYHIPYSYSPVLSAQESAVAQNREHYQAFLTATKAGYLYCKEHAEEAAAILQTFVPESDRHIDLSLALARTVDAFGDETSWGKLDADNVSTFLQWLSQHGLNQHPLKVEELIWMPAHQP